MEERIRFYSGPFRLEGLLDRSGGDRGVIITHPHPLYGGDMDNFVVKTILEGYRKKGYTTLRFNFRGVEGSEGSHEEDGMGEVEDVKSAIAYLYAQGVKEVELAGYSFGAWVNAHIDCKAEKIHRMLMVSPPVDLLSFENVQTIACPCLAVCGDRDEFASVENVRNTLSRCNPDAVLKIIPNSNHFYSITMKNLEDFLREHLEQCRPVSVPEKAVLQAAIDLKRFFRACSPACPLDISKPEDRKYYIDFSPVRSGSLIRELKRTITLSDKPGFQLFTGHAGCGKSTELLRLKKELEDSGYHVVYVASGQAPDMNSITDLLCTAARKVSESLSEKGIVLTAQLSDPGAEAGKPEAGTGKLSERISKEIFATADQNLKEKGKAGLVVIADAPELCLKNGQSAVEAFKNLACHSIFTVPLSLIYSSEPENLNQVFGLRPKVLAMVPVQSRNGEPCEKEMDLLKQMIMARAFPDADETERMKQVQAVFEKPELPETLCRMSGGSFSNLMRLLFNCLQKNDPPFSQEIVEEVLREERDELMRKMEPHEKDLLRKVMENQAAAGERERESLLRSHFIFEYQDKDGVWFSVNPLLNFS